MRPVPEPQSAPPTTAQSVPAPGETTAIAGFTVRAFDRVGSTNDEALRLAADGAADRTCVWALQQDRARGRRGRAWYSPRGNLFVSTLLRGRRHLSDAALLSFVASLALGDTVAALLPATQRWSLKWPNDVLLNGRKVAGILLETEGTSGDWAEWVVIGCGLNIVVAPSDVPYPATCLNEVADRPIPVEAVLPCFLDKLDAWLERFRRDGFAPIRWAWLDRAQGLGDPITVRLPDGTLEGRFQGLEPSGALLLRPTRGGEVQRIRAGDVFFGPADQQDHHAARDQRR